MESKLGVNMNPNEKQFALELLIRKGVDESIKIYGEHHDLAMRLMAKGIELKYILEGVMNMSGSNEKEIEEYILRSHDYDGKDIHSLDKCGFMKL